ncbi:hypothetical protein V2J09_024284 [Rumex salicifolius]
MLTDQTDALPELRSQHDFLLPENTCEEFGEDEEVGSSSQILYMASFEELASNYILYDTIIWFSISLLLVLAWGVGVIMLLYLPYKRYILSKDIYSRRLYVTPTEVVYKVLRPSFIPFWGEAKIERRVPLSLSIYGLQTIRIESISSGKAAPVDELQVQGVHNPGLLRKVIISEASKVVQESSRTVKTATHLIESMPHMMGSLSQGAVIFRSPSKKLKASASSRSASMVPGDLLLYKIDEVNRSVKRCTS